MTGERGPRGVWTDERVKLLKKLWGDGLSASQIAKQMRGVTRNAVIGKVHRLGFTLNGKFHRDSPAAPQRTRPSLKTPRVDGDRRQFNRVSAPYQKPKRAAPPVLKVAGRGTVFQEAEAHAPRVELKPDAFAPLPGIQPVPFIERKWPQCAWPVGGEGAEMLCCGDGRDGEGPYCRTHRARGTQAVRPGSPRTGNELARSLRRYA